MASGDTLLIFTPMHNEPPATAYATLKVRNEQAVLNFLLQTNTAAYFSAVLPQNYAGGGITLRILWTSSRDVTGLLENVIFRVSWQAFKAGIKIDSTVFAATKQVTQPEVLIAGDEMAVSTLAFLNGVEIDSLAVGEKFRIKVERLGGSASDTLNGDAEVHAIEIKET